MGNFDTHGGYFAPKDYMKVEAGGSHEENPNGGVQIGVDSQGVPNLLEEGEPVYKDYVYSDNIKASERFLKDNNIPDKYAGELYSRIADKLFEEAEERPNDPISRNGLEAMLGRLADAQEGQKAYNEQKSLERELKKLSPEELAALEGMIASEEQQAAAPEAQIQPEVMPEQVQPETVVPEQIAPEQIPAQPVMRNGGRLFATGGPTKLQTLLQSPAMVQAMTGNASTYATSGSQLPRVESTVGDELGYLADVATAPAALATPILSGVGAAAEIAGTAESSDGVQARGPIFIRNANRVAKRTERKLELEKSVIADNSRADAAERMKDIYKTQLRTAEQSFANAEKALMEGVNAGKSGAELQALKDAYNTSAAALKEARRFNIGAGVSKAGVAIENTAHAVKRLPKTTGGKVGIGIAGASLVGGILASAFKNRDNQQDDITTGDISQSDTTLDRSPGFDYYHMSPYPVNEKALGGKINRFDGGGDKDEWDYDVSHIMRTPPTINDSLISTQYPLGYLARQLFGTYSKPDLSSYDTTTYEQADLANLAQSIYGTDHTFTKPNLDLYAESPIEFDVEESIPSYTASNSSASNSSASVSGNPYLSTFPRYAGAIGSGLLGLYNVFQRPDRYTGTRYRPFTPSGRISLQDQVYNPVDQNMMLNQALAQGNSTARALRNSGIGPSAQAAIIAQDNNLTGNLGNTLLQTWDANNQRRNQVIAANNQNEAQRAQFDYSVDTARQRALAEAQYRNAQNDLMLQRLNYAAEGDKYAAISNQISNALQAISGIGQENFAMNQVNSNTANEGYGVFGGGIGAYAPLMYQYLTRSNTSKNGGKVQRKKK